ncbi:hypothetical protein COW36_24370 [bacterium (Candidatus Blackallbacteria) CG17_big_fil_post_rev_8_21_14_2_50_48_46]|uniref:Uncharacterized protein n=1 Tax=bacterium (Candidatus Blackallbacteria) CG17_big_fil_post_rev_8_21_14_2_50_48_46 TaxID=2014261 RepID=A0A2M7FXD6_9BACT|nr:MAG: hypothetical protein COW64_19310 [bacterium (Candidatus Blackallbacteria) CG18_big_fil_WC_8_21_14_2_50_49_26]PIW13805.1 MAG: hypothetical protein COW36_24370 [bacterium (Candidatus Blackallbacteria) CG17_big_fil_post_rev_8_21_14_2_50_48_46]PIW45031.1 MAG: hypothetical protein COW20_22000 [bacterium (Candidatus Blackallbacteria) CG13_big_fil_rev_8_21_14_2_50_49_14]
MAEQKRPPRSLRGDSGPQYYRDWSAADAVISQDSYSLGEDFEEEVLLEPQEMHMVEDLENLEDPSPPVQGPVYGDLPPLSVITPADLSPVSAKPVVEAKPKVQITRVNKPSIQRARRYNELAAEDEKKKREEAAEAARRQAEQQPEMPSRTRSLNSGNSHKTTELKTNIKDIAEKIDETAENVKTAADSIGDNIRQIGDKLSASVVGGVKKVGNRMVGMINRWGKKSSSRAEEMEDQDFEDEPLPSQPQARPVGSVHSSSPPPAPVAAAPVAESSLLDQVPPVPPVQYGPLLKEGIVFLSFEKNPLPSEGSEHDLEARFLQEALEDLRKCIKMVQKLPDPKEGPYRGIPMAYLFKNSREQDVYFFLHYVQAHPGAFKDKQFKFSEAFASWVLKRSHKTVITEPFPEVPALNYFPLYKQNIRFLTVQKKAMVLATGKSPEEVERLFMEKAMEDVRACIDLVAQFPAPSQGPYKGRPMRQIFRNISERDIYFFLHYINSQPEIFQNQNFKFSEAFASWLLKRSHETVLPSA